MKIFITFLLSLFCFSINAQTTWLVNNNPGEYADFTTLQEAIDGAAAGDVLLIQPSGTLYGDATIDKQVHIIGGGFFKPANNGLAGSQSESVLGIVDFEVGSENSKIEAVTASRVDIHVGNISIESCRLTSNTSIQILGGNNSASIISNIYVNQCFSGGSIGSGGYYSNVVIGNSRFNDINLPHSTSSGNLVFNCVMRYDPNVYSGAISNCIILNQGMLVSGNSNEVYTHNFFAGDADPINGNVGNVDMLSILVGESYGELYSSVTDEYIMLTDDPNNPAIGAGANGEDLGITGGNDPYVPYGLADIPQIYNLLVPPNNDSDGNLNVEVKVKTNN